MPDKEKKPTILCVDDDSNNLALLEAVLVPRGYETISAESGQVALEKAVAQLPDLILLDIMMPDVDGTRVHECLSQNAKTKGIPLVFLTALVREEEVAAGRGKIGGLNYISKSTPKDKFVKQVKDILASKK